MTSIHCACACRAKTALRCASDAFSSELTLRLDIDVLAYHPPALPA
jgi:hypothetical protein